MVDLSTRRHTRKVQRSIHLDDSTSDRLDLAAKLSGSTRSQILDRLIWEDLKLPGDDEPDPNQTSLDLGEAPSRPLPKAQIDEPEEDIDID